jgi:glycosyltransferase involved in cell wall biosynthesis
MRLRVALLSTAVPNAQGSMGAYGDLVLRALQAHAPHIEAVPVALRHEGAAASGRAAYLREILRARARCAAVRADVYHLLDGSFGFMAAGLPWDRTVVTVHDLIPALQCRGRFAVPPPAWPARLLIRAALRTVSKAGAVCTVSANTASDLQQLTGRVADAVLPLPLRHFDITETEAQAGRVPAPGYVLHVGNNSFYKNRAGVLDVFGHMLKTRPDLRLVLAGAAPDRMLKERLAAPGLKGSVEVVPDPDDGLLAQLYRNAGLLLFPSLYEGFGWPPLEAMAQGCPVVCSNEGSLPEVVGDAALMAPAADTAGLAAQALRVLADSQLAAELSNRGAWRVAAHSVCGFAEGLSALYRKVA